MKPIEGIYIELTLRKKKWLLSCSYNPNKNKISNHLEALRRSLDLYSAQYEDIIIFGDFNVETEEPCMGCFCELYGLKNLIKEPTCFKNPQNPSSIDLILTNNPSSFLKSHVIETGLSDFHKMTVAVMKTTFQKLAPKIIHYRDYKNFCNDSFRQVLLSKLSKENINPNSDGLETFLKTCISVLDTLAPLK